MRKGDPASRGKPSLSAEVRRSNGWFGGADKAPPVPRDTGVISEQDLSIYVASFARTGFFGPDSWYMNDFANFAYAAEAKNGGSLTLPVLFLHAAYDYICETMDLQLPGSDASPLHRPHRGRHPLRSLDGPGAAHPGQRGAGKMARRQSARRLAGVKQ